MTYGRYGGVGLTIASDLKYVPGKGEVRDPSRIFVVDALEGYAWDAGVHTGDNDEVCVFIDYEGAAGLTARAINNRR